jgi:hypothetical protein
MHYRFRIINIFQFPDKKWGILFGIIRLAVTSIAQNSKLEIYDLSISELLKLKFVSAINSL